MAQYASTQDLRDRYPERDLAQLTDPDGLVVDEVRLSRALADASDEIDGYLQGRYRLPLAEAPRVLKLVACDVAMYRLLVLRPLGDIEDARKRYEDSQRFLRSVAEGKVQMGLAESGAAAQEGSGPEVVSGRKRFGADSMQGF
jgi:phage gp36-like protein